MRRLRDCARSVVGELGGEREELRIVLEGDLGERVERRHLLFTVARPSDRAERSLCRSVAAGGEHPDGGEPHPEVGVEQLAGGVDRPGGELGGRQGAAVASLLHGDPPWTHWSTKRCELSKEHL